MAVNIKDGKRTVIAEIEWFPRPDGLERAVVFQPGYNGDHSSDPSKDYGVHGMEIWWYLRGLKGAVHFCVFTEWVPGVLYPGHGLSPVGYPQRPPAQHPQGCDLGYHARVPQWAENQEEERNWCYREDCHLLGGPCYGDGSATAADRLAKEFTEHGEPVIWAALEDKYEAIHAVTPPSADSASWTADDDGV